MVKVRRLVVIGLALLLLTGMHFDVVSWIASRTIGSSFQMDLIKTSTNYGCRYYISAVVNHPPGWVKEYFYSEFKRGTSLAGVSLWAHREAYAVRLGSQINTHTSAVGLHCL